MKKVLLKSFVPPKKKVGNQSKRGGAREGAGRPAGQTKVKKSVSLDGTVVAEALDKWEGSFSSLLEKLLRDYVK